ncbi:unnamed protein product [Urochloa decumbens]|uniref:F-box domain-containing protein n=1 Tax=Urochloa decumbens TaxID=240449 RepID=A0ABC9DAS6_9POAL
MDLLPEDLLVDILRRLPPRPLAMCRSVSKDLRAAIDGRGRLLAVADRVPLSLRGIFVNYVGQDRPYFFSRRAAAPPIVRKLNFVPGDGYYSWRVALHQNNGLLLFKDWHTLYVCNPATRRWEELPPRPKGFGGATHVIFDPTVSLHYEVISFDELPRKPEMPYDVISRKSRCLSREDKYDHEVEIKGSVHWPPSVYTAQVFSSRTGQWETRAYVREDDVAVTLLDVWSDPWVPDGKTMSYCARRCNAICWRGAFYVHCHGGFVMRLSMLENKYQVIKTPVLDNVFTKPRLDIDDYLRQRGGSYSDEEDCLRSYEMEQECLDREKPCMHLGKSEHGIYYTALCYEQLQVWVLHEASESHPMPEWELKHKADIRNSFLQHYMREDREEMEMSWSLERGEEGSDDQVDCGWDSGDDSVIHVEGEVDVDNSDRNGNLGWGVKLLGYHPSKEIIFLGNRFDGFAYYLGSSKLQYLGMFLPVDCCDRHVVATHESFIYTPCTDDFLPDQRRNATHDNNDYFGGEGGDLEEEDTDEEYDLDDREDEDFESSEEDGDNDKDEDVDS